MVRSFFDMFPGEKPLIGMIHLAGGDSKEKIDRALEEINIYEGECFDGAIIEDFHGSLGDVTSTLEALQKYDYRLVIGVNVLRDPYMAFELADKYGAKFVQFDTIQASKRFDEQLYNSLREKYPHVFVFGGVRFKYIPQTGKTLEEDIRDGMQKCDAIVTTGRGTGIETPTQKLQDFREIMGNFPLIVGAGVNNKNIKKQISITNGAIIGSYLKGGNTEAKVDRSLVRKLVDLVK